VFTELVNKTELYPGTKVRDSKLKKRERKREKEREREREREIYTT
jgi:hypothetical protein